MQRSKSFNALAVGLITHARCRTTFSLMVSECVRRALRLPKILPAELRDRELLPHMLKANPHKSTFANMMLFLRCQVEDFAWKKWGSPEALDTEWERRTEEKKKKKNKKFEEGLKELRKRTREGVWQRRKDQEHKHAYGPVEMTDDGHGQQICHECGFTVDVEII